MYMPLFKAKYNFQYLYVVFPYISSNGKYCMLEQLK